MRKMSTGTIRMHITGKLTQLKKMVSVKCLEAYW